ncbi:hypothetical protein NIES4071_55470 [Calothrix sp. NIES-4071]|nr:hypothetical protein NIES4071_55470 [Calothrix sp. NIES-4071]BAZ59854.1 hypothetical protein NIES4105_55420 [Calothrix sp. NIES-4105]
MEGKTSNEHGDIYSRLMAISQEAFESEFYETAYHALCGAMHHANSTGNEDNLKAVQEATKKQQDWIDCHAATHKMSTESTMQRGGVNLYKSLITQIQGHLLVIKSQHRQERMGLG